MVPRLQKCQNGHPLDDSGVCWLCKQDEKAQAEADAKLTEQIRRIIDSERLDASLKAFLERWHVLYVYEATLNTPTEEK